MAVSQTTQWILSAGWIYMLCKTHKHMCRFNYARSNITVKCVHKGTRNLQVQHAFKFQILSLSEMRNHEKNGQFHQS